MKSSLSSVARANSVIDEHSGHQRRRSGVGEFGPHTRHLADVQGLITQAMTLVQQQQRQLCQRRHRHLVLARQRMPRW